MGCFESQPAEKREPQQSHPVNTGFDISSIKYLITKNNEINYRILMIGTSETGKSTFCKQLRHIYGPKYDSSQKEIFKAQIKSNIINDMKLILETIITRYDFAKIVDSFSKILRKMDKQNNKLNAKVACLIDDIYDDPLFQVTLEELSLTTLGQYSGYFIRNNHKFVKSDYKPTTKEILYHRVNTQGVMSHVIRVNDKFNIEFVDIGGKKSQRQEWYKYYKSADFIIYFASLSSFEDISVREKIDSDVSDSLSLFSCLSFNELELVPALLLLTKKDLFEEKFVPNIELFKRCFPGYPSSDRSIDTAVAHVKQTYIRTLDKNTIDSKSINLLESKHFDLLLRSFLSDICVKIPELNKTSQQLTTS